VRRVPWLLLAPALALLLVFAAAFSLFLALSFALAVPGGASVAGPLTLANYRAALLSPLTHETAWTTLSLAFRITAITAVLGYPLAYVLARTRSQALRRLILFGLVVTFLSGGVTRAYAWLLLLGNRGLINQGLEALGLPTLRLVHNETGVVISVVHFLLPFFTLTMLGALKNVPPVLEEVARNLGAKGWRVVFHVVLPLSLPGLMTAISLTFAGALSAFLFPELLGGGRVHMAANLIYERIITDYNLPAASAMAALFLALSLAVLGGFAAAQRRLALRFPSSRAGGA
jgi:putative spermidine/putrescine transport system permease protein